MELNLEEVYKFITILSASLDTPMVKHNLDMIALIRNMICQLLDLKDFILKYKEAKRLQRALENQLFRNDFLERL